MLFKRLWFFLPTFFLLLSCDEFVLSKSVRILNVSGQITFDQHNAVISGHIDYHIRNVQDHPINEIYLVSYHRVKLENVSYNHNPMKFELGAGFKDNVYRVFIPTLTEKAEANIILTFSSTGPYNEDRMILNHKQVFFDVKKIWLPVPFADRFTFPYKISVSTTLPYKSVMGGAIVSEVTQQNVLTRTWKSEINNALLTGSLFIFPLHEYSKGPIHYYTDNTNNLKSVFDYATWTLNLYNKKVGYFPFSQLHLINNIQQYTDMEEVIDGEYMANAIHLSPTLFDYPYFTSDTDFIKRGIPFLSKITKPKLFEIIAHEITHSYISTLVRFDNDKQMLTESMTEFMAAEVMGEKAAIFRESLFERNRILLINMMIRHQDKGTLWKYLLGCNIFASAFTDNNDSSFKFLSMLVEKYRFTAIQTDQLAVTAQDVNTLLFEQNSNSLFINSNLLKKWNKIKPGNISVSITNRVITNTNNVTNLLLSEKKEILIKNTFPIGINGYLNIISKKDNITNSINIPALSETNISIPKHLLSVKWSSPYHYLESKLYDNSITIKQNKYDKIWGKINEEINSFYTGSTDRFSYLRLQENSKTNTISLTDAHWLSLNTDKTNQSAVTFRFDVISEHLPYFYIQAYKISNNKTIAYVLFKGRKKGHHYYFTGILDPTQ